MIVEIAFVLGRVETLRQHVRDDVLRGGLTRASGHRHHAATPALPRPRGQLLEPLKRVRHPQYSARRRLAVRNLLIHNHGCRALPEYFSDVVMPIVIWPPQRKEQIARQE